MMRPDLHLHSTCSDGVYTPIQLARLVQRADVTLFSLTDHDTLSGLSAASDAAYERGLAFLPGVEINTEGEEEIHILGYGVQADDPVLNKFFQRMAEERIERVQIMANKLKSLRMPVPIDEIISSAGPSVGRPHLARAMVRQGYVAETAAAFDRYLGHGRPAYAPRKKISTSAAIMMLRERGAVPVLAHPGLLNRAPALINPLLNAWQDAGLMGIEVYHPANRGNYAYWDRIARERGLLVTGGSDYHDEGPRHGQIGETIPEWRLAGEDGWKLFQTVRQMKTV